MRPVIPAVMRAIRAVQPSSGGNSPTSYRVAVCEMETPVPNADEVLVRVHATALNRADLLQAAGKYPPPPGVSEVLGLEAVGIDVSSGERVACLLRGGGLAEYVAVPRGEVMALPQAGKVLDDVHLAAMPEALAAAHHILFDIGKFSKGDSVLVHAGASGVGSCVVQMAKTISGATVIASVGSGPKVAFCRALGADVVVNYKENNIVDAVLEATGGRGVALVLDCVGASMFRQNSAAIRTEGRWVMYGLLGGAKSADLNLAKIVSKRIELVGTALRPRTVEYRSSLVSNVSRRWDALLARGTIAPVVDSVFDGLDSVPIALMRLASNESCGKVVVRVRSDS